MLYEYINIYRGFYLLNYQDLLAYKMQCHCMKSCNVLIYKINRNTVRLFLLALGYYSLLMKVTSLLLFLKGSYDNILVRAQRHKFNFK